MDHMVVRRFLTIHKMVEARMQLVHVPRLAPHPRRAGAIVIVDESRTM
jgi:hypothetical protein